MGNREREAQPGLSVAVTTFNSERTLERALSSVRFADEIVVVDSGSTDGTLEIARRFTDRIIRKEFLGYGPQKNLALESCGREWIFILDSDEELSPELAEEVGSVVSGRTAGHLVYTVPRLSCFIDRWMRHSGWYPDRTIRLVRRGSGRFDERAVHEAFVTEHPAGHLSGDLLHHTYVSISDYVQRQDRYSSLAALEVLRTGRRPRITPAGMALTLLRKFLEVYIWKRGFLDGQHGFVAACLAAYSVFLRQAKLWKPEGLSGQDGPPHRNGVST